MTWFNAALACQTSALAEATARPIPAPQSKTVPLWLGGSVLRYCE